MNTIHACYGSISVELFNNSRFEQFHQELSLFDNGHTLPPIIVNVSLVQFHRSLNFFLLNWSTTCDTIQNRERKKVKSNNDQLFWFADNKSKREKSQTFLFHQRNYDYVINRKFLSCNCHLIEISLTHTHNNNWKFLFLFIDLPRTSIHFKWFFVTIASEKNIKQTPMQWNPMSGEIKHE